MLMDTDSFPYRTCRRIRRGARSLRVPGLIVAGLLAAAGPAAAQVAVVTHHDNIARTGWNAAETVLTPVNVGTPGAFGQRAAVTLDGVVDAQPLVVPGVSIAGDPNAGTHDVVYVATQANTIFAIDPTTGSVLLSRNFGTGISRSRGCGATDAGVGITGTPAIDLQRHTMYVIVLTADPSGNGLFHATYRLHALDLSTLADTLPPVIVSATQTLTDGSAFAFSAAQQRQRPALLQVANRIYAAFGSFCDNALARGWVLGWRADTLKPIDRGAGGTPVGNLTNRQTSEPAGRFLSTIWMSGAGLAADASGIYYVTGNSDHSGTRYDPAANIEQSVVRLSQTTASVLDLFTPSNLVTLDADDADFGSGGVMLLPSTAPGQPPMAAAAGKFGTLYLLDRTNLGGYTPGGPDKVLATAKIGSCWCAPSYFNDGTPTLVSSGGQQVKLWNVQAAPATALVLRAVSAPLATGPDPGFFTSVSSHGKNHTIVWAVTRPVSGSDPRVWLYAFGVGKPGTPLAPLFAAPAGTWTELNHNPNIVPVVANGRVYVASDAVLTIFGVAAP